MSRFILDRRALGLHPDWENILLEIIDLELGLANSPRLEYILAFILEGYSRREIAARLNMHHRQITREIDKLRQSRSQN